MRCSFHLVFQDLRLLLPWRAVRKVLLCPRVSIEHHHRDFAYLFEIVSAHSSCNFVENSMFDNVPWLHGWSKLLPKILGTFLPFASDDERGCAHPLSSRLSCLSICQFTWWDVFFVPPRRSPDEQYILSWSMTRAETNLQVGYLRFNFGCSEWCYVYFV